MSAVSDERIAEILTDESMFRARVRQLWSEAADNGDSKQVELCRLALAGDESAAEKCAYALANAEVQS